MLPPAYFDTAADDLLELYSRLDQSILRDIVRRLTKTGRMTDTAVWQTQRLQDSGMLMQDIIREVANVSGASDAQVRALFEDAGVEALQYDVAIYEAAGLAPLPLNQSPVAAQVLQAGLTKTAGHLRNLTMTTASAGQEAYISAATLAEMQVESGAFDYITAIRNAVKSAAEAGSSVIYPSGHTDQLDVAVRRAVLTGVGQTTAQLSVSYADDMGCDLVETTAHPGARPSHQVWQGKVFSRSGAHGKYPDFVASTGYGTGSGLCGWNCRHSFFPYFEGLSTNAYPREKLKAYENQTVQYDGQPIKYYDATQLQRGMERRIRATKRELAGYDEGAKSDDEQIRNAMRAEFDKTSVKLKQQEARLQDFVKQTGLDRQREREQVPAYNKGGKVVSFGRSQAQKAVQANRAVAKAADTMYNLGSEEANIKAYLRDKPLRDRIQSSTVNKTIEPGQFNKHVPGTLEYTQYVTKLEKAGQHGPSRLTITQEQAQNLIDKYHGTGILSRTEDGRWRNEEVITAHPDGIGIVVNNLTGAEAPTSVFKIKYRPKGTHVIPDYPSKKGAKGRK